MGRRTKPRRRLPRAILTISLLLSALILDSNLRLVTDHYTLPVSGLPASFEGARIVLLSDLHDAEYGPGNRRLLDAVRDAQPEVIFFTGDISETPAHQDRIETLLRGLTALAPVYYVDGNHEWACGWTETLFDLIRDSGVTLLQNRWTLWERGGDAVVVAGAQDPNGPADMATPEELVSEIRAQHGDTPILMLNHRNNRLPLFADLGVEAVFSGHAHGGVFRFPFTDGLVGTDLTLFPKDTSGVCVCGDTRMVVSRGLGNVGHTFRLLNNPEVVVVVLSRQ